MKANDKPVAHAKRHTSAGRHGDYVSPVLIRYGDMAKSTAGSKETKFDGGNSKQDHKV